MIAMRQVRHVAAGDGERVRVFNSELTFKVRGDDTDGAYALILGEVKPQDGPPVMHTHPFAESFYVLSGEFVFSTVEDGEEVQLTAEPGSVVHVPAAVPHTFKNVGNAIGTLLSIGSPIMERFFIDVDRAIATGRPIDRALLGQIFGKYGFEAVGRPRCD
jgi:quercetin dioxygenase-like cupin family protein